MKTEHFVFLAVVIFATVMFSLNFVTYDFYTHLFFAKHYKENWFSLYEPKIGGGFYLSTYPPLIHQLIALLSFIFPFEIAGYIITFIFWVGLSYFSSKFLIKFLRLEDDVLLLLFVTTFFSLGILKSIFILGQITTIALFTFIFASCYYFMKCIKEASSKNFIIFSLLLALSAFTHVYAFLILPVLFFFLVLFEWKSFNKKIKPFILVILTSSVLILFGLFPLFYNVVFGYNAIPSTEIFHGSRYPLSSQIFLKTWILSTFGLSLPLFFILIILAFYFKNKDRNLMKLLLLSTIFLVIGLGYTTFIPKLIFPKIHYWLTYDKFILFSSLLIAPLLPVFLRVERRSKLTSMVFLYIIVYLAVNILLLFDARSLYFGNETNYREQRENAVNYAIQYLNEDAEEGYRYQTFGFGKPINKIYFYSKLSTLDTDYFTGRGTEWINDFGIEEIDITDDVGFLDGFMTNAGNYSIKYIITIDGVIRGKEFYFNLTKSHNWMLLINRDFNDVRVSVWQNPLANLSPIHLSYEKVTILNYFWGILPLLVLFGLLLL